MDYLTKWLEVFPSKNQNSLKIACLLVKHIIPRHGVPVQVLSDKGTVTAFLSKLVVFLLILVKVLIAMQLAILKHAIIDIR